MRSTQALSFRTKRPFSQPPGVGPELMGPPLPRGDPPIQARLFHRDSWPPMPGTHRDGAVLRDGPLSAGSKYRV